MDKLSQRVLQRFAQESGSEHQAVAPPGWEKTVKDMKKHKEIDNPFALAWSMKNKGDTPHKKEASSFTSTYYTLVSALKTLRDDHGMDPARICHQALGTLQMEDKKHNKTAKEIRTPGDAVGYFGKLLTMLKLDIDKLPEHEQTRAKELWTESFKGFSYATTVPDEYVPQALEQVREHLTELERLLSGQMMMFARVAHESVTEVFKELFHLCDNLSTLIENDVLRRIGIKPVGKPSAPRAVKPKAPKTYKQAQDEILYALRQNGWEVSDHLKIPHATNHSKTFRYWFKPQAIYYSTGSNLKNFGEARSLWAKDYRRENIENFVKYLEEHAHG